MIQHILLPEKIGSYYLFGKRVIGIEISKTHIYATVAYFKGSKITIEQCIEASIDQQKEDPITTRIGTALKKIFALAGKYQEVRFAISSAQIIFKTMQLPFNDVDKIKKVIDFEVEPLLPFSITESIIDFIITKSDPTQQSCEVLIAATQKQYISQQLELFTQNGVTPHVITIDLFELYGLYTQIQHSPTENCALIEINDDITKVIFISNGQVRFIRTLTFDIELDKKPSADHNQYAQVNNTEIAQQTSLSEPFTNAKTFADNLAFTFQSFTSQAHADAETPTIYVLGAGANISGLIPWLQQALNMTVTLFNPTRITENPHIHFKSITQIPIANTISAATALSSPITEYLNLRQKEFAPNETTLLIKQLICGILLILIMFASLITHSFLQERMLRKELNSSKAEATKLLEQWFPTLDTKNHIDDMLEEAEVQTKKNERMWFAFARSANNSLLNLLLELTKLNREGFGLVVEKITIDQERGIMTLKAHVKDHKALARLENELKQSKLFSYVQPQNDINFTMELRFTNEREGGS